MPSTMPAMWVARATALCLAVHGAAGCTDVGGGAVELSWKLRPASSPLEEKFVACDPGEPGTRPVVAIQLDWEVRDQAGSALWPCTDNNGVTGFDLPAGSALLQISPVCDDGPAREGTYTAPAAQQRNVNLGDTVSLGAVELILQVTSCDLQPCICS